MKYKGFDIDAKPNQDGADAPRTRMWVPVISKDGVEYQQLVPAGARTRAKAMQVGARLIAQGNVRKPRHGNAQR